MPTVAPKMPLETSVGFAGAPERVLILRFAFCQLLTNSKGCEDGWVVCMKFRQYLQTTHGIKIDSIANEDTFDQFVALLEIIYVKEQGNLFIKMEKSPGQINNYIP